MPAEPTSSPVAVAFVGGGPGASDLLTLRALEAIRGADVVVHDRLVPPAVLAVIPGRVERICIDRGDLGDADPGGTTGELLVRLAASGRRVVRLKGGDPTVFARLAEEIAPLRLAGVPFEIVPGVTAALAAAAAVGIPLTTRESASSLTLVTGHVARGKEQGPDFGPLAALPGTLVVYMGIEQIAAWSRGLLAAGRRGDTPVAVVSRCSWPDQQVAVSTLAACADEAARQGWRPPAVLIVGDVAAPPAVVGPLAGRRVIVTRPAGQEAELVALIRAAGGQPLHVPVIEIADPPSWEPLDAAIGRLDSYDWIVFASANAVRGFLARLRTAGRDGRALGTARLAAIGPATRRELEDGGYVCDLVPADHRSEGLLDALAGQPPGGRFLLVRGAAGRDVLPRGLLSRGHAVDEVAAYASRPVPALDPATRATTAGIPDAWVTVTSGGIAESAARLFGGTLRAWRIASLSPVTSAVLRRFGLEPAVEAAEASVESLMAAICRHEGEGEPASAAEPSGSSQRHQTPQGAASPPPAARRPG